MKKCILIILTILFVISSGFLVFNYKNYVTNNNTKKDYEEKINEKEKQSNDLNTEFDSLKAKYEELSKEKEKEIENYNKWKAENEEIISYLT